MNIVHRMYGAVNIGGNTYRVKTTVKEDFSIKAPNSAYSYEATKIELLEDTNSSNGAQRTNSASKGGGFSTETTKLLKDIDKSYDKGKNFLMRVKIPLTPPPTTYYTAKLIATPLRRKRLHC